MSSKYELQKLLIKMGGTPESGDNTDETIKKITEVYEPGGGGSGLPSGGTEGQLLRKNSSDDGDASWASLITIPAGGSTGQALVKNSSYSGDVSWGDVGLPSGGYEGMILKKNSSTAGDASWDYPTARYVITVTLSGSNYTTTRTWSDISVALSSDKYIGVVLFNERYYYQKYRKSYPETYIFEATYYEAPSSNKRTIVTDRFEFAYINSNMDIARTRFIAYAPPKNLATDQGKVLKLAGTAVGDFTWADIHEIPIGGTQGQVLKKNSSTNYDVSWANDESGGGGNGLLVTFEYDRGSITCDTDINDIWDAFTAGDPIRGILRRTTDGDTYEWIPLRYKGEEHNPAYFEGLAPVSEYGSVLLISINYDGLHINYSEHCIELFYNGYFYTSSNSYNLYTDVKEWGLLYGIFAEGDQICTIKAVVTIDNVPIQFEGASREYYYDEDADVHYYITHFCATRVINNNGTYELHTYSFDSKQPEEVPTHITVENYAHKKVVLSAV